MLKKNIIMVWMGVSLLMTAGCGEKKTPAPAPTSQAEQKASAPTVQEQQIQEPSKASAHERQALDQVIPLLLPEDTHALGVFPSLASTEQTLKLGALLGKEFSSERRGLRPLQALNTIGASIDSPDSWSRMGISPRSGLLAAIVDSNTLIIALETTGIGDFLPKWKMMLTVLTGSAPTVTPLEGGLHKITVGNPRAWALAADHWVMVVLTSGAEEPTEKALALGPPAKTPLANNDGFKTLYPTPKPQRILNVYVNLERLLTEELNSLRAEKHGSWLYAEKLLATAIRDKKPQRVIQHWEQKVENERTWSKDNRAGLLAAADVLEETYGGINHLGAFASLTPYGLEAEGTVAMTSEAKLRTLFSGPHPTSVAHVGEGNDAPPIWIAGDLNFGALKGMFSHLPLDAEGVPIRTVLTALTGGPIAISAAYAPGNEGKGSPLSLQLKGLSDEVMTSVFPLLQRAMKDKGKDLKLDKIDGETLAITRGPKAQARTIPKEGNAKFVGSVLLTAIGPWLQDKTKTTEPTSDDPVEQAIVGEMNQLRVQRDVNLGKERVRFLESLGSLSLRILPTKSGWTLRVDLLAQTGLEGASKAWVNWMSEQTKIEKEASKALAEKRRELRSTRGGRRNIPQLP
jgi:hypothetical protein